jgi:metallo-beta-lactamase class B
MPVRAAALILLSTLSFFGQAAPKRIQADPSITCDSCDEWNRPREPCTVFGNTYSVGVTGLSAVLIASDAGLILVDGGLPQSVPLIDAGRTSPPVTIPRWDSRTMAFRQSRTCTA